MLDFSNLKNLHTIESNVFNGAFETTNCQLFILPGCLRTLGGGAISYNNNVIFTTVQIGGPEDPSQLQSIGYQAIKQNASRHLVQNLVIYVEDEGNVPTAIRKALDSGDLEYEAELSIVQA